MIKFINRRKTLFFSVICLTIVCLLSLGPFSSPCACLPLDKVLVIVFGLKSVEDLSPETISKGFLTLFPKASLLNPTALDIFYSGDKYFKLYGDRLVCDL